MAITDGFRWPWPASARPARPGRSYCRPVRRRPALPCSGRRGCRGRGCFQVPDRGGPVTAAQWRVNRRGHHLGGQAVRGTRGRGVGCVRGRTEPFPSTRPGPGGRCSCLPGSHRTRRARLPAATRTRRWRRRRAQCAGAGCTGGHQCRRGWSPGRAGHRRAPLGETESLAVTILLGVDRGDGGVPVAVEHDDRDGVPVPGDPPPCMALNADISPGRRRAPTRNGFRPPRTSPDSYRPSPRPSPRRRRAPR